MMEIRNSTKEHEKAFYSRLNGDKYAEGFKDVTNILIDVESMRLKWYF